jgi:hypothetical protein
MSHHRGGGGSTPPRGPIQTCEPGRHRPHVPFPRRDVAVPGTAGGIEELAARRRRSTLSAFHKADVCPSRHVEVDTLLTWGIGALFGSADRGSDRRARAYDDDIDA